MLDKRKAAISGNQKSRLLFNLIKSYDGNVHKVCKKLYCRIVNIWKTCQAENSIFYILQKIRLFFTGFHWNHAMKPVSFLIKKHDRLVECHPIKIGGFRMRRHEPTSKKHNKGQDSQLTLDAFINQIYLPNIKIRKRSWKIDERDQPPISIVSVLLPHSVGNNPLRGGRQAERPSEKRACAIFLQLFSGRVQNYLLFH